MTREKQDVEDPFYWLEKIEEELGPHTNPRTVSLERLRELTHHALTTGRYGLGYRSPDAGDDVS
jgi:hypothetical protein